MHDLSLGGPVPTGETSTLHPGQCYDGVYGCHKCYNAANNGRGTPGECDSCHRITFTRVIRASDEPVMYAKCAACIKVQRVVDALDWEYEEHGAPDPGDKRLSNAVAERDRLRNVRDYEAEAILHDYK